MPIESVLLFFTFPLFLGRSPWSFWEFTLFLTFCLAKVLKKEKRILKKKSSNENLKFFSFYFIFLIFLYNFVMHIQLVIRVLHLNFYEGIFEEIFLTIHHFAYFLICPINLFCVIERIFATVIPRYEHLRNYPFFVGSILLAVMFQGF